MSTGILKAGQAEFSLPATESHHGVRLNQITNLFLKSAKIDLHDLTYDSDITNQIPVFNPSVILITLEAGSSAYTVNLNLDRFTERGYAILVVNPANSTNPTLKVFKNGVTPEEILSVTTDGTGGSASFLITINTDNTFKVSLL